MDGNITGTKYIGKSSAGTNLDGWRTRITRESDNLLEHAKSKVKGLCEKCTFCVMVEY